MRKNGRTSVPTGSGHRVVGPGFYTWESDQRYAASWGRELGKAGSVPSRARSHEAPERSASAPPPAPPER